MFLRHLLGRSKQDSTANTNANSHSQSVAENVPVKASAVSRHDAASYRAPLGVVSNQPRDLHRPADDGLKKPAKAPRMDTSVSASVAAAAATRQTVPVAPAPKTAAAPAPSPAPAPVTAAAAAAPAPVAHRLPDLAARRRAFGTCPADIDSPDVGDPMFCSTYVQEVYDYLRAKEIEDAIDPDYMSRQQFVSPRMRAVLIDWMVEVQLKFRMTSETLYLSVNIVDKYLQKRAISRDKLQLLGVTAMLIASKFEEIYSVEINDFVFICDNVCTAPDIIAFEGEVLSTIRWSLTSPCPLHFLRRYSKASGSDGPLHTMSKYLLELSLGSYHMLKYLPSTQAAAAVLLTRHLTATTPYWTEAVEYHSGYRQEEIVECARDMLNLIKNPDPKYKLVTRKYSGPKLCSVARTASENADKISL